MIETGNIAGELEGNVIKEIFEHVERVAELHGCLTCPGSNNFRFGPC